MTGGKGGNETTTQQVQVPGFLQGFAEQGAQTAGGALGSLQGQLGDAGAQDLVAPFSADQLASFEQARQAATGAGGAVPTALDTLGQTARGDFLFGGPGFDAAVDAAFRAAQPRIFSQFGGAGRMDSGLAREAIASAFADPFAAQFGQERQRQLAAAQALPGIAGQGVGLLGDIGALQQQQAQQELLAPITAQQQLLAASGGAIPAGAFLGSSATAPTGGPSPLVAGAGGALSGAATGATIGAAGGPIGATGGAIIGGGLGLLGALG